jgi:hypothetical protein
MPEPRISRFVFTARLSTNFISNFWRKTKIRGEYRVKEEREEEGQGKGQKVSRLHPKRVLLLFFHYVVAVELESTLCGSFNSQPYIIG